MCTPQTQRRAKNAWNGWLDERDLAPGEVISNWLKRHTQRGLALAAEYAKAGYDKALERADQAWAARSLLDSGSPAQEAIDVKQQCDKAVAADAALLQMLKELSTQYAEEAKFPKDADSGKAVALWASRYGRAAEMLTAPSATPATPQRSAVEQDAMMLQQLRQAQAHMTNKLLGTTPLPAGYAGYAGATSSRSSASSASKAKAQERVEELLQKLFDLHDLKANGVLEEEELIKMNEKVSLLHYGKEKTDKNAIREKFRGVFREQLDPQGRPVPFSVFRNYMQGLLLGVDADPEAQVMMVEQFIAEAETARQAFRIPSLASESDHLFCRQDIQQLRPQQTLHPGVESLAPWRIAWRMRKLLDKVAACLWVGNLRVNLDLVRLEISRRLLALLVPEATRLVVPRRPAACPFKKGSACRSGATQRTVGAMGKSWRLSQWPVKQKDLQCRQGL